MPQEATAALFGAINEIGALDFLVGPAHGLAVGLRIAIVEPLFGNLRQKKPLDRVTLQPRPKVKLRGISITWFTTSQSWRIMDTDGR
jgi:hypothetical protein